MFKKWNVVLHLQIYICLKCTLSMEEIIVKMQTLNNVYIATFQNNMSIYLYFLKQEEFYSNLGTKVATNAPLADKRTESLFSFDLKQENIEV